MVDPSRFTPEAKANRHPFVYLPFGTGPRNCVGMRFAQLQIRMVLAHFFHKFSITACSETKVGQLNNQTNKRTIKLISLFSILPATAVKQQFVLIIFL